MMLMENVNDKVMINDTMWNCKRNYIANLFMSSNVGRDRFFEFYMKDLYFISQIVAR